MRSSRSSPPSRPARCRRAPGRPRPAACAAARPSARCAGSLRARWSASPRPRLGPLGEAREVRCALGLVGLAALLRLLARVEQEVRVVSQLLDAREAVLGGMEAGLQEAQREGGVAE